MIYSCSLLYEASCCSCPFLGHIQLQRELLLQYDFDDRPRRRANPTLVTLAALAAAVVVIGTNAWLVHQAALDRSWGALSVLIMIGPVTNGVIALVTFASSFLLRWLAGGASVALYLYAGVLLPLAAILVSLNNGKGTSNVYRYSSFFKRFLQRFRPMVNG